MSILAKIQSELNAPKDKYNSFGKYHYRSCESILEAVKPLLKEADATLTLSDDIVIVGTRIYVKSTAVLKTADEEHKVTASAREAEAKKGMDDAQITGSASSYARKYALNGLFAIDDTKDPDATNDHGKQNNKSVKSAQPSKDQQNFLMIKEKLRKAPAAQDLDNIIREHKGLIESLPAAGTAEIYKYYDGRVADFESA